MDYNKQIMQARQEVINALLEHINNFSISEKMLCAKTLNSCTIYKYYNFIHSNINENTFKIYLNTVLNNCNSYEFESICYILHGIINTIENIKNINNQQEINLITK